MDPFRLLLLDSIYTDCVFEGNSVTGYANASSTGVLNVQGGAVAHTSGSAAFSVCNFESNAAATSSYSKAFSSNGIRTSGGALYLNSVAATIDASNLKDNSALAATDARGGAVGIQATFGPSSTFIKAYSSRAPSGYRIRPRPTASTGEARMAAALDRRASRGPRRGPASSPSSLVSLKTTQRRSWALQYQLLPMHVSLLSLWLCVLLLGRRFHSSICSKLTFFPHLLVPAYTLRVAVCICRGLQSSWTS